jgi:hypothetical protein
VLDSILLKGSRMLLSIHARILTPWSGASSAGSVPGRRAGKPILIRRHACGRPGKHERYGPPRPLALYPWRWSRPAFDDSAWSGIDLHADDAINPAYGNHGYISGWTARGYPRLAGFAWYRLRIHGDDPEMGVRRERLRVVERRCSLCNFPGG